jgi:hypothetical protein
MSPYSTAQKIIYEITEVLYPQLEGLLAKGAVLKSNVEPGTELENLFYIFDELKVEFHSLKNYEVKLVFPGIERFFGQQGVVLPQSIHINELHGLLRKKEDCLREKIMELEVAAEECGCGQEHPVYELINFFRKNYFPQKDVLYILIAKLQKGKNGGESDGTLSNVTVY